MTRIQSEQFPVVSAGIDWLSIRSKEFDVVNAYSALSYEIFSEAKDAGEKVEHSVRVGFSGRSVTGCFLGHKEETSLLTLSSEVARRYAPVALRLGGSVARIDLQATIDTGDHPFNLASESFYQAKVMPLKGGRPRELKLTTVHPCGDTLNVNKRTSDNYGRIYDYGSAHATNQKHKVWRYEVEFKRGIAKSVSSTLAGVDDPEGVAEHIVYSWFFPRLPNLFFSPRRTSSPLDLSPAPRRRDVLLWFEESLSVCVARAIKDYGEARTMKALGLARFLNSDGSEVITDAGQSRHTDEVLDNRKVCEPDHANNVLVQKQRNRRH